MPTTIRRKSSTLTRLRDELRYVVRLELTQDNSTDTITFRNAPDELAVPIRRFGAFLPGEGSAAPASIGARCIGASCRPIFSSGVF